MSGIKSSLNEELGLDREVDDITMIGSKYNIYKKLHTHSDIVSEDKKKITSVD